jgi:uncharacterized protein YqhQ
VKEKKRFHYGGQAVIEGVMMRGQKTVAVAVRRPDGEIEIKQEPLSSLYSGRFRRMPFIRGVIALIETLVIGTQTLFYSAQVASIEDSEEQLSPAVLWGTVVISMVFAVAIFFLTPYAITHYLIFPNIESAFVGNILEGVIRMALFIAYLAAINMIPDIRTVFAYHGAEHKTINAYESGEPLEIERIKKYPTAHRRCGTGFLLVVMIIAILVFALLGKPPLWAGILSRIVLIPVIASVSYEIVQFSAAHSNNRVFRALLVPGLMLQSMTTREPDEKQMETAIHALKKVVESDADDETAATEDQSISSLPNS